MTHENVSSVRTENVRLDGRNKKRFSASAEGRQCVLVRGDSCFCRRKTYLFCGTGPLLLWKENDASLWKPAIASINGRQCVLEKEGIGFCWRKTIRGRAKCCNRFTKPPHPRNQCWDHLASWCPPWAQLVQRSPSKSNQGGRFRLSLDMFCHFRPTLKPSQWGNKCRRKATQTRQQPKHCMAAFGCNMLSVPRCVHVRADSCLCYRRRIASVNHNICFCRRKAMRLCEKRQLRLLRKTMCLCEGRHLLLLEENITSLWSTTMASASGRHFVFLKHDNCFSSRVRTKEKTTYMIVKAPIHDDYHECFWPSPSPSYMIWISLRKKSCMPFDNLANMRLWKQLYWITFKKDTPISEWKCFAQPQT